MKVIFLIVATVIGLAAVVLLIGALLPRKHTASRQVILRPPPAEIYTTLHDFAAAPKWRPDLQRVEMLEPVNDHIRFREHSKQGRITYEVIDDRPPEKLITRIIDQDLGYSGTWTYELSPAEHGTHVRITEEGDVPNVVFRFMSRCVFGHTATMDAYLQALGRKFGEEVTPQ